MARTATGIDIGLRTAKFLRGSYKGGTFHVSDFAVGRNEGADVLAGWKGQDPGFKPTNARVGLSGRDLNIRYTRVPQVPDWQLRRLMRFEVEGVGDQSGAEVASDFNLLPDLPEVEGEDVVLLAMARESLLEGHIEGLAGAGGKVDAFSPNALALYNAFLRYGVIEGDTVLLANIGHDNVDVVICRGPDLVFARNLSGGSRLFDDAIAQRFGVGAAKAEEVKIELATLEPGARYADANQEKASRAIMGAAGQLLSLLQSTVVFCKSQLRIPGLKIDRVLLCGGGAALQGLPQYLQGGMSVPVELFDPFRVVNAEGLDPETADLLEEYKLEAVVALGLATMGSDPEAYSLEILPAALRKKREFLGGTAWAVAAGVLALVFLGWDAWRQSVELGETSKVASAHASKLRTAKRTDSQTRELLAENAELEDYALQLQGLLGAGEQVARTVEVLDRRLPEEFWLARLENTRSFDEALGVLRERERPILRMDTRARQGTSSMATLYEGFLGALREGLPGARLKHSPGVKGTEFEIGLTLLSTEPLPAEDGAATEEGEEE